MWQLKVSSIKNNPKNPRKITNDALEKLKVSIERDPEFMKLRPIVVDENMMVLGGNQRLKAIKSLGMKEVPEEWVIKAENLTEEQRRRFVLVDNAPSGMVGDWDAELLKSEWFDLDLLDLGFDPELLDLGIAPDCEIPGENKSLDEDAMSQTENECPSCGFKW